MLAISPFSNSITLLTHNQDWFAFKAICQSEVFQVFVSGEKFGKKARELDKGIDIFDLPLMKVIILFQKKSVF